MITCDRMLCVWTSTSPIVAKRFQFILKSKQKLFLIVVALFSVICLINVINLFFKIEARSFLMLDNSNNQTYNYTDPGKLLRVASVFE
jgi:hypothetical protein